jgi:DNA-binding CsgD family transcriptional regulator
MTPKNFKIHYNFRMSRANLLLSYHEPGEPKFECAGAFHPGVISFVFCLKLFAPVPLLIHDDTGLNLLQGGGTLLKLSKPEIQMLSCSDLANLSKALIELHTPGSHTDFPSRLFASLRICFTCDFYSYNELTEKSVERVEIYPNWDQDLEVFKTYVHEHPCLNAIHQKRLSSAVKISDFVNLTQWHRTHLSNEFFQHRKQNYQLAFISTEEQPKLGVTLNRQSTDFSEDERCLLDLLRPHLIQAYRDSKLFSYLNEAAGLSSDGLIIVDRAGRIRYANANAIRMMKHFFGADRGSALPSPISRWLQGKTGTRPLALGSVPDLTIDVDGQRLTVQTLGHPETTECRLLLRVTARQMDARPLQRLGLTNREAEILLWVTQGKSNSEIAIILASKVRTIAKHLERVFAKLMVENRTAAAHAALEVLQGCACR